MKRFVVLLRFTDNERRLEVRPAHREYLRSLHEQGKLLTAGPWADDTGALLIYQAADEAELDRIIADDPARRRTWSRSPCAASGPRSSRSTWLDHGS